MEKIRFSELQDLRESLWNDSLSIEQRYRLVDVIHLLMECPEKVDFRYAKENAFFNS